MKFIRTTGGVKRIEDSDPATIALKLREILTDHRASLISRLLSDLALYIDYRFSCKPDARGLQNIKERLYTVRNSPLDLGRYDMVLNEVLGNQMTYVIASPFYLEIDEIIGRELNATQLTLVQPMLTESNDRQ